MDKERIPDIIKFDFAIDEMINYCENQCDKKECCFGYDNCPM